MEERKFLPITVIWTVVPATMAEGLIVAIEGANLLNEMMIEAATLVSTSVAVMVTDDAEGS